MACVLPESYDIKEFLYDIYDKSARAFGYLIFLEEGYKVHLLYDAIGEKILHTLMTTAISILLPCV